MPGEGTRPTDGEGLGCRVRAPGLQMGKAGCRVRAPGLQMGKAWDAG